VGSLPVSCSVPAIVSLTNQQMPVFSPKIEIGPNVNSPSPDNLKCCHYNNIWTQQQTPSLQARASFPHVILVLLNFFQYADI
jgi:hypothetical protein